MEYWTDLLQQFEMLPEMLALGTISGPGYSTSNLAPQNSGKAGEHGPGAGVLASHAGDPGIVLGF